MVRWEEKKKKEKTERRNEKKVRITEYAAQCIK